MWNYWRERKERNGEIMNLHTHYVLNVFSRQSDTETSRYLVSAWCQRGSGIFIVNFEHILHLVLVFLLLTLNM